MRRVALLACLAAVLGIASAAGAVALPLLSHHGRWLTDPQGRVVIVHGVQIDKLGPSQPIIDGWIDMSPSNVRFIAAEGFNAARVSLGYSGYEPQVGHFDDAYLNQFVAFDRRLASAGVYDLVDMMQGEYSTVVGGWGFPAWMTITGGAPNNHAPFAIGYIDNLAEDAAWDYFWANTKASDGVGLEDHFARGLARIARAFAGAPGLLGFEILNEPWPGVLWPTCASPTGCLPAGFDQTLFTNFYRRVIPALRAADPSHLIVYEPNLLFDYGAATQLGRLADPNLAFAFHNYCLATAPGLTLLPDPLGVCAGEEALVFANAEARSNATGDALLMDEWGNTTDLTAVDRLASEADKHMTGWTEWAYEDCCHSLAAIVKDASASPTAPGNLNLPVLKALVRPYPQVIAGTPRAWAFDPASDAFTLSYSTAPVAGGGLRAGTDTQVELPALRYPTGYTVSVTGATVTSAPDTNELRLVAMPSAAMVELTVTPAHHHPAAPGPFAWPATATAIAPADCPPATRVAIRWTARRVALYIDGVRVPAARRGHRRVELPAGLADGTVVRLAAGRHSTTAALFRCRLPAHRAIIRRRHRH